MKIAIVGGGVAGLTCAQLLRARHEVVVFEKEKTVGGLIRCAQVEGSLFHICGGHVFNTKNQKVLDWFWSKFNREQDFLMANRHSAVCLEAGRFVDYPIENHVYQLDAEVQLGFIGDLQKMILSPPGRVNNFGEFLQNRFGKTLYDLYFKPYNDKVWRRDLAEVPLSWLSGKLPMPTVEEMLLANINHVEERQFVHSSFYYAKHGGSQFIADALAKGSDVRTDSPVGLLRRTANGWLVNNLPCDRVIFCGNLKDLPVLLQGVSVDGYSAEIARLESHGTTAVFCETEAIPYSWFYQPSPQHLSHRFICTGNFAPSNNAPGKMTCTVEFTDSIGKEEVMAQLRYMPYHPQYLAHCYSPYTYPIQHHQTRAMIRSLKNYLRKVGVHLCGRFAEWEYYNMDAAMFSAMTVASEV